MLYTFEYRNSSVLTFEDANLLHRRPTNAALSNSLLGINIYAICTKRVVKWKNYLLYKLKLGA